MRGDFKGTLHVPTIPGVCTLEWAPTVGNSFLPTDPASVVGKEIFAKVREKFSGSIDADAPDFVIYVMALDSIFAYIAYLKRLYRTVASYTPQNHYLPDALIRAEGYDENGVLNLHKDKMRLWNITNELIYMTRRFNIPAVFDIINRHYWLSDNVYTDAPTANAQFYKFVPKYFYKYTLMDVEGGKAGGLTCIPFWLGSADTVGDLYNFGRTLIDALAASDDAYIISGYLMRAYEGTPAFAVDELRLDEPLTPIYEPEVLMQIENAQPIPYLKETVNLTLHNNVYQNPADNSINCQPSFEVPVTSSDMATISQIGPTDPYLSIRSDAPTVADVTLATRLKMGIKAMTVDTTGNVVSGTLICGSEIHTKIKLTYFYSSNGVISLRRTNVPGVIISTGDPMDVMDEHVLYSFDWNPILPMYSSAGTGTAAVFSASLTGDVHNFTVMESSQLEQLNRVCLYSEFNAYGQI